MFNLSNYSQNQRKSYVLALNLVCCVFMCIIFDVVQTEIVRWSWRNTIWDWKHQLDTVQRSDWTKLLSIAYCIIKKLTGTIMRQTAAGRDWPVFPCYLHHWNRKRRDGNTGKEEGNGVSVYGCAARPCRFLCHSASINFSLLPPPGTQLHFSLCEQKGGRTPPAEEKARRHGKYM